jgi:hypothetical protein
MPDTQANSPDLARGRGVERRREVDQTAIGANQPFRELEGERWFAFHDLAAFSVPADEGRDGSFRYEVILRLGILRLKLA